MVMIKMWKILNIFCVLLALASCVTQKKEGEKKYQIVSIT